MADNPAEVPAGHRPRAWSFLVGVLVCRILNSLHWALVGGLGWGVGLTVGKMVPLPGAATLGGAAGLALVMLSVLTLGFGKRSAFTPVYLASFSGIAFAYGSLSFLHPNDLGLLVMLGAGVGFLVGLISCVMKQYFAPVSLLSSCLIAIMGAALFAGIGSLVGGMIGWAAAGGISLFCVAILAECLRREPAIEVDADEQPVRVIPRREMCRQTTRQSWSLTSSLAWGWHGLFAGLLGSLWASWAADYLALDMMRKPILMCGGLAAVLIIATRLGILKPPGQSQPSDGAS
jgi:hypothetical protein